MLRIRFGDRSWTLDTAAAQTMGDIVAVREIGLDPARLPDLFRRLSVALTRDPKPGELLELAELGAQVAYLAAVREDNHLRWRDFVFSLSLSELQNFRIDGGQDEPAPADAGETGALGAALADAGAAAPAEKKTPAKRSRSKRNPAST